MDLGTLLKAAPAELRRECRVDVSDVFGLDEDGKPVEFVYREPDLTAVFNCAKLAQSIRAEMLRWTDEQAQIIGMMALSHVAPLIPENRNANAMYVELAEARPKLMMRLLQAYGAAFPDLLNPEEAAKKGES